MAQAVAPPPWKHSRKFLWGILLLAFVLRLGAFVSLKYSRHGFLTGDGQYYSILAKNILYGRYQISTVGQERALDLIDDKYTYTKENFFSTAIKDQPTNYWSPGYPTFLAVWYGLFGAKPWLVSLIGCLVGVVSCYLLYLIGSRLIGPTTGLWSAGLLAIHPIAILFSPRLESEIPALTLFLLVVYLFLKWRRQPSGISVGRGVILGALLGLLIYFRSTYFLLLPVLGLGILVPFQRKSIVSALVFVGIFYLLVLPWGFRNQRSLGQFMLFETRGVNVFYGELTNKLGIPHHFSELDGPTELDNWRKQKFWLREALREQPTRIWRIAQLHVPYIVVPLSRFRRPLILLDLIVIAGVLWGFYRWRERWREVFPLVLFAVLYAGSVLLILKGNEPRFHLPFDALAILFLATSLAFLTDRLIARKSKLES